MKKTFTLLLSFLLGLGALGAQDTFSIVAVDTETGEVGSAGASCVPNAGSLGGVILISGIIPGRGGINGQALVCIPHVNLNNALEQMEAGLSPQEIIEWLQNNDACGAGGPQDRQYGIADFDSLGNARTAAFTGTNTLDWAGHITGPNYSIQGNILLGPQILDSMEARFLREEGSLAKKLMAAMQGANVPGADSRCLDDGVSSFSAFLQVFKPTDPPDSPFLRLNVAEVPPGVEPIDSLQALFDAWMMTSSTRELPPQPELRLFPNPSPGTLTLEVYNLPGRTAPGLLRVFDFQGREVFRTHLKERKTTLEMPGALGDGLYWLSLEDESGRQLARKKWLLLR
ncbi:MAG: DUF1028 domain-containing protein [Bacteroidetes bacterium]|nr:MAG: DUF1028 domain-containing protein [Bacteroidota bacterium]